MTRPTILDLDLVVVPREADATMWTAAAVPLERWRKETFFGSKNDAAVLSYRAALSSSPYPTAWDDVRKYVEKLEVEAKCDEEYLDLVKDKYRAAEARIAELEKEKHAALTMIAMVEKRLADADVVIERVPPYIADMYKAICNGNETAAAGFSEKDELASAARAYMEGK